MEIDVRSVNYHNENWTEYFSLAANWINSDELDSLTKLSLYLLIRIE